MKYQRQYNIMFSGDRSSRWKRHVFFWLAVYLYHMVRIGLMMPSIFNLHSLSSLLLFSFTRGVIPNLLFTYAIVYFLIPKYLERKNYFIFIVGVVMCILLLQSYGYILDILKTVNNETIGTTINGTIIIKGSGQRAGFIRLLGNPPLIFAFFLSLKILKNWHLEQLKTASLAKENTNAELQLLKAQVHPHFLFNTLNNIYSFTLTQSPLAGALVNKLSGMLHYMIHECEQNLVPLEKEIKLIQDYIGLEKVRYGNRLTMQVEIEGDYEDKLIAPLLMIPFVENSFKHGASVMRGQQWIRLNIEIKDDQRNFTLSNSKPSQSNGTINKKGIGLANVQKRLQLLYPGKHILRNESTSDTYLVYLQVGLQQLPATEHFYQTIPNLQPV